MFDCIEGGGCGNSATPSGMVGWKEACLLQGVDACTCSGSLSVWNTHARRKLLNRCYVFKRGDELAGKMCALCAVSCGSYGCNIPCVKQI
jgi:hypothetical protein